MGHHRQSQFWVCPACGELNQKTFIVCEHCQEYERPYVKAEPIQLPTAVKWHSERNETKQPKAGG